ncbi:unnamed protein product [Pleuronectes platessa]|uniref:Uncharacterized protein n=1 Tax=Pleuronectes platessa TaxID=8262 RepID=A0A9N7ZFS3_PLEPL|nr:unnamed protein product [Pleuronectes platessa]
MVWSIVFITVLIHKHPPCRGERLSPRKVEELFIDQEPHAGISNTVSSNRDPCLPEPLHEPRRLFHIYTEKIRLRGALKTAGGAPARVPRASFLWVIGSNGNVFVAGG